MKRARAETPGCEHLLHFNNAGAALMPAPVHEAVKAHLDLEARIGGYEAADQARPDWERTYDAIATLLHCRRDEVAVVENATRAWDMAFYALPLQSGDRILTARAEYVSNYLAFLQLARKRGVQVDVVPSDAEGQLDVDQLRRMVDGRVKLIAVTHAPGNGGLVNPVADIGAVAREHGIPFLVDACQSAGQMPLDVEAMGCDMLSSTSRKFLRGPRGVGFLYVRRSMLERIEPPFIDLHSATWTGRNEFAWRDDARKFESWECSYALKIGLGKAVDYALGWGLDNIRSRVTQLAAFLRERLAAIPGVTVHDLGRVKSGICTFAVAGRQAGAVRGALLERRMNVSVTNIETTRLDMEARGLTLLVRASVHYYNTEEEVDRFVEAVREIAR